MIKVSKRLQNAFRGEAKLASSRAGLPLGTTRATWLRSRTRFAADQRRSWSPVRFSKAAISERKNQL